MINLIFMGFFLCGGGGGVEGEWGWARRFGWWGEASDHMQISISILLDVLIIILLK